MSLADELRKLVERIKKEGLYPEEVGRAFVALLAQHVVAEPPASDHQKLADIWRAVVAPAHAAEQPKLTEEQVSKIVDPYITRFSYGAIVKEITSKLNALLTSPQKKEKQS